MGSVKHSLTAFPCNQNPNQSNATSLKEWGGHQLHKRPERCRDGEEIIMYNQVVNGFLLAIQNLVCLPKQADSAPETFWATTECK